ncbi:hypothetical protein BK133_24880 [Paenibacillus sp. FSL H8-0548]|nr:hypothetical protein BK133_24880 [Paenibacillus sp. FSL H8-0548]
MRHELKLVYFNAYVQDRQLGEAEKHEVTANVQDRLYICGRTEARALSVSEVANNSSFDCFSAIWPVRGASIWNFQLQLLLVEFYFALA